MNVYNNMIVEQRLDPRGRRHRPQRRAERPGLQQHDHEEPDDGHGRDLRTARRPRPAVDLGQQRPAAGHPARGLADLQQPAAVQQHLLGQPGRHPGRDHGHRHRPRRRRDPSTLGPRCRRRHRAAGADELGRSSRTRATTPTRRAPTNSSRRPAGRRSRTTLSVSFATWRQNPAFVDATLVALEAPPGPDG